MEFKGVKHVIQHQGRINQRCSLFAQNAQYRSRNGGINRKKKLVWQPSGQSPRDQGSRGEISEVARDDQIRSGLDRSRENVTIFDGTDREAMLGRARWHQARLLRTRSSPQTGALYRQTPHAILNVHESAVVAFTRLRF